MSVLESVVGILIAVFIFFFLIGIIRWFFGFVSGANEANERITKVAYFLDEYNEKIKNELNDLRSEVEELKARIDMLN